VHILPALPAKSSLPEDGKSGQWKECDNLEERSGKKKMKMFVLHHFERSTPDGWNGGTKDPFTTASWSRANVAVAWSPSGSKRFVAIHFWKSATICAICGYAILLSF
jgi:hypothetical protein